MDLLAMSNYGNDFFDESLIVALLWWTSNIIEFVGLPTIEFEDRSADYFHKKKSSW